ncbi:MAG: nucleotide exchange factor GrpE [Defluviitaleaceae bacterium]|nr:nucleotide exchange factor GrpE [Defluviitaleaceae bacterium]
MTKKNGKNAGLARENTIFGKWMGLAALLDRFVLAREEDFFRRVKTAVGLKIAEGEADEGGLSAYDVEIFDCYTNIMHIYRDAADHHLKESHIITTPEIKSVWGGIYELLMSRLMQYEGEMEINPIQAEKKIIAADVVADVFAQMGEAVKEYRESHDYSDFLTDVRKRLLQQELSFGSVEEVLADIINQFEKHCNEHFYSIYRRGLEAKLTNLNNLELRKQAESYNTLLKEEIEILRQIIVVQAMALEKIAWDGGATPEESAFIAEVLGVLRETYQKEGQTSGRINRGFLETANHHKENLGRVTINAESPEEFAEIYSVDGAFPPDLAVIFENFKDARAEKYAPFAESLKNALSDRLGNFHKKLAVKKTYFAKKASWQISQMSMECCDAFAEIAAHFEDGKEHFLTQEEKDIIKGVAETVVIKIDSIKDGVQQFEEEANAIIEGFPAEGSEVCGEDFVVSRLVEGSNGAKVIKEILDEFVTAQQEEAEKAWAKHEEPLAKKVLAFQRDNLFFELSTFEEIMHYSVSRLRESLDVQILEFVVEIDKQYKNLEQILARYGIEKIVPTAHEPFNAKEHEVLMAEVQEGFKKGEIIKTMNSGYRNSERVITRANVIAAR